MSTVGYNVGFKISDVTTVVLVCINMSCLLICISKFFAEQILAKAHHLDYVLGAREVYTDQE